MVDPTIEYTERYSGLETLEIGIVGCGEIVENAHLPAYDAAGFAVAGVTDTNAERADTIADQFGVTAYPDLETMVEDVAVVDVAVPPRFQPAIVDTAVDAGCHLLCQKPLAVEFEAAEEICERIAEAGVTAAVNQQMRWEKSIRAVSELLEEGALGTPLRATIEVNIETDWSNWGWMLESPRLEVLFHSIHYLDTMRYLFGEPVGVTSSMARVPDQAAEGETRTHHLLEYPGELRATIDVNHNNWADPYARFRFEGTEGLVRGTIGLFDHYPDSGPDTFEFLAASETEAERYELPDAWFPDAFIGTMGSLLESIEASETPPTHVEDNLETLRLANATYKSWNERRTVDPATVTTDHEPEW
ncbi:Gfo/Idh/MocA family oxidoreductase [Natronolimnobius sp. AArcel1]|uniref:Gfo/Idh/MocA family protein n=1 Tax=Natronolimnobius sp. AArcel1 TaxID=1679093 RepID=UPI0013EA93EA|nr:Gfo/Idh/MocA family oxidoreductase [Natronolimnobius sp. AArcel1]NGM70506.1 Gfo/Idh/MocA family oxidoreductase [Natronolimnobius sp. AArcel1]